MPKRPLPLYTVPFDPSDYLKVLMKRYSYLARHFERGASVPGAALTRPFNSIFTGISRYDGNSFSLTEKERDMVRERLGQLLEALAKAGA